MNCQNCQTENSENATFCKGCGIKLQEYDSNTQEAVNKKYNNYLAAFGIIYPILFLAYFIANGLRNFTNEVYFTHIAMFFYHLSIIAYVLLPLSIKNKTYRTISFIMFGILIALRIYNITLYLLS